MATYPRQDGNRFGQASERDLNPAVVHEGRVMVAPSDADAIFAFDAASGRLLWKTEPIADDIKLTHVLGVAKGRLVVTGDRVLLLRRPRRQARELLARLGQQVARGLRPRAARRRPDLLADAVGDRGPRPADRA